jgi:hypothetical protein
MSDSPSAFLKRAEQPTKRLLSCSGLGGVHREGCAAAFANPQKSNQAATAAPRPSVIADPRLNIVYPRSF